MSISGYIRRTGAGIWAAAISLLGLVSCDSVIYDYEGDCEVYYRLKFRYDMNLKFADAFAHEVKSVRLYAFDAQNKLVWQGSERGDALASGNYVMTLPLAPGKYRLVAWCGLGDEESFLLPDASPSCRPEDLHCRMRCLPEQGTQPALSDDDLKPLFHGMLDVELPVNDDGGEYLYEMPLTKDTNVFRVILQHLSGEDIAPKDFKFSIEDDNGWLDYDNRMLKPASVVYEPWAIHSGQAGVETNGLQPDMAEGRAITMVNTVMAEMTVSRLFMRDWTKQPKPMLKIRASEDDRLIASVPIIDYALMLKGEHHRHMDDQEYLDRADEYNMTFFLDENDRWVSVVIQILSWRLVINNTDLN